MHRRTAPAEPTALASLERARSLVNVGLWTIDLQLRRLNDEEFFTRWLADFQFLIVALRRTRRAAQIAASVTTCASQVGEAVRIFDHALPSLATMRNVGEHIDDYALDHPTRHHKNVNRTMLQVAARNGSTVQWLDVEFDLDEVFLAAQQLFDAVRSAHETVLSDPDPRVGAGLVGV